MDTQLSSQLLAAQHRQIDAGIKGIVEGNGTLASLHESLGLLRLHLYLEEAFLFPPLEKAGLTMPVFVMQREHGEIWPLLMELTQACANATPVATLHESAEWLLRLLQVHNRKEEEVVYTAADRFVQAHPEDPLAAKITAAALPEGWTCAMAPH